MPFSTYTDNKLIDHLLGSNTYTKPASKYLALYVGDPTSGGTEVSTSGSAYTRLASNFTISSNVAANSSSLEWSPASSTWGTVTHAAIYDASTGGNMLVSAPLSVAKPITTGDIFRIPANNYLVTLT
ncbi:hypothetical protein UFOVP62_4 [uncultured Caudovirales phage]|uniref:Uncharacterized protein n=1 Tax=uncultured Caudovirales phage TaxID=2100421 RepID=A0A6J5KT60_9CAUD|nr:hypothetical protein UFOVP62_4 [uncultured Caudovirales phage]